MNQFRDVSETMSISRDTVSELLNKGMMLFAKEAEGNVSHTKDLAKLHNYSISLIDHEYPAKTPVMWNAVHRLFCLSDQPVGNAMMVAHPKNIKHIFDTFRKDKKYTGGGLGSGFKEVSLEYLDELDISATCARSANIVVKDVHGDLKGYNTDGEGYVQSLEALFFNRRENLEGKKAVMLGAGGTASAITFALAKRGAKTCILNRTVSRAEKIAHSVNVHYPDSVYFGGEEDVSKEVVDADVVLNVSKKGSHGEYAKYSALAPTYGGDLEKNLEEAHAIFESIPQSAIMSDIILKREPTSLLKMGSQKRHTTLDGVSMVINQAVEAFYLLYGTQLQKQGIHKDAVRSVMNTIAVR